MVWLRQIFPVAVMVLTGLALSPAANGDSVPVTPPPAIFNTTSDVMQFFCAALDWMFWGLIILGMAMFIVGGYRYATSGGEAERVGKATKTLMYAAIAIAVGIIAKGVPSLIGSFLSVNGGLGVC